MSVKYDFYESPVSPDRPRAKSYHARVVGGYTVETKQILDHIQQHGGLSRSAIVYAMSELGTYMAEQLSNGNRVHLDGIGYFSISLDCPRATTPSARHAQSISLKSVNFKPEKELLRNIKKSISFVRTPYKTKSQLLSMDNVKTAIEVHFRTHDHITRRNLEELCGLTRTTAIARLKALVEEGYLVNKGTLKFPIYVVPEEMKFEVSMFKFLKPSDDTPSPDTD